MATDNDITQDETLDEDLVPQAAVPVDAATPPPPDEPAASAPADAPTLSPPEEPDPSAPADAPSPRRPEEVSSASSPSNGARYLSEREADELRKVYGDPKMKRMMRRLTYVGIAALILGAGVAFQWSRTEDETTWPGVEEDQVDDGEETITLGGTDVGIVYFPHVPGWILNRRDGGNLEVYSCVGKFRDKPFHLTLSSRKLADGYRQTMEESFAQFCIERKLAGEAIDVPGARKGYKNAKTGYGFPVIRYQSLKVLGNRAWFCHGIYFRYRDWECAVDRGCLASEYRALDLIKAIDCLVVKRRIAGGHFAIPDQRMAGTPVQLLRSARKGMQRNLDVSDWREIDGALRTLLSIAHEQGDKDMIAEAADAWGDWRRMQADWFARKRFAYRDAREQDDKAACNALRLLCLRKLEGTDDARLKRGIGSELEEN